jgi:hypothetical protein
MRRIALAAVGMALVVATSGCGGGDEAASSPSPSPTKAQTQTPTPSPTVRSVLTGETVPDGPTLVMKIDNSRKSLPHEGLATADVVYVQQVEGGVTRLAAVYSTQLPKSVVPVRSARETDTELLPMYGPVAFGFSGSVSSVHALVGKAGLVDVSADRGPAGYNRVSGRPAPYNLAATPSSLIKRADGSVLPKDVGFRFGPLLANGAPTTAVMARFPAAKIGFAYDAATERWVYTLDGRKDQTSDGPSAADNVIVQSVTVETLKRSDVSGASVPFTRSVGRGKAVVLRDGRAFSVTWERASTSAPTRWLFQGKDFPLKPGQTWVVLLDKRQAPTLQ